MTWLAEAARWRLTRFFVGRLRAGPPRRTTIPPPIMQPQELMSQLIERDPILHTPRQLERTHQEAKEQ